LVDGFHDNPMFSASPERLRALADELERDGEHELAAVARRAAATDASEETDDTPEND